MYLNQKIACKVISIFESMRRIKFRVERRGKGVTVFQARWLELFSGIALIYFFILVKGGGGG